MEKKVKNILVYAASLAASLLAASCNEEINETIDDPAAPTVHSIEVTVPVSTDTKASYAGGGAATTFEAGDKLYIKVQSGETCTYVGVLDISAGAVSTFTGTLYKTAGTDYSGSDIITDCTSLEATLLPSGYDDTYYVLTEEGGIVTGLTVEPAKAFSAAATKAAAVPQVANASYNTTLSGAKTITLTPRNAVLYYTLSGLAASTSIDVTVSDGTTTVSGSVDTNADGEASFAVGYAGGTGSKTYTVSTTGKDDDAVTASLVASKVYNVTRFMYPVGAIHGQFTVSSTGTKVCFAQGNLTYSTSSPNWSFLSNSWEYNTNAWADDKYGKVDGSQHFYWSGDKGVFQTVDGECESAGLISDITSALGSTSWRGLSLAEWRYLLGYDKNNGGTQSSKRTVQWHYYAMITSTASIGTGNKRYLLIFPDDFQESDWNTSSMGAEPTEFDGSSESSAEYTADNFTAMQTAGIVILPAAGFRMSTTFTSIGENGNYWSSTSGNSQAYTLGFYNGAMNLGSTNKEGWLSLSVRLVQNLN